MAVLLQVLASGSKGNAVLVSTSKTTILMDAGLSAKELVSRMGKSPMDPRRLEGIVLSHEHSDHTRGAGVMSRRFGLPVYLSRGTLEQLPPQTGQLAQSHVFQPGRSFTIGDLSIHPFSISHDAREPSGFVVCHEHIRVGICTDLGVATHLVRDQLGRCNALVLEANHDVKLLMEGPYPPHLKQRIRSNRGHLSNVESRQLLEELHHDSLRHVFFAHLSETNNHPQVVLQSFKELMEATHWQSTRFAVAKQHEPCLPVELA